MATANNTFEPLLNERDVAHVTGLSVASVRRWRLLKIGPRATKIGAAVRYKPEDLKSSEENRSEENRSSLNCAGIEAGLEFV